MSINDYTPQQIEEILQAFFDVAGTRQYIGARYVPIFGRGRGTSVDWDGGANAYEPLSIVYWQGDTYTSRRYVPAGIDITDSDYWVITGRYNAQVEQYRQEVLGFSDRIDGAYAAVDGLRDDVAADYVPFPDPDHFPKYGTDGQVLSTLANGDTEWVDPVTITSDVAEPIIEDWLDAHPEATTTVQDGAVTTAKLADGAVTDAKLTQRNGILSEMESLQLNLPRNRTLQFEMDGTLSHGSTAQITLPPKSIILFEYTNNSADDGFIGAQIIYDNVTIMNSQNLIHGGQKDATHFFGPQSDNEYTVTMSINNINARDITIDVYAYDDGVFPVIINDNTTYLPDANNAYDNVTYIMVLANASAAPAHLPSNLNAYEYYMLTTYKTALSNNRMQRLELVGKTTFKRSWARSYSYSLSTWTNWFEEEPSLNVFPTLVIGGSGQNYAQLLPDFDNAIPNSIYRFTNTDTTNLPAHCPTLSNSYMSYRLTTYSTPNNNTVQQIFEQENREGVRLGIRQWTRRKTSGAWTEWVYMEIFPYTPPLDIIVGSGQTYTSILRGVMAALQVPHSHVLVKAGTYNIANEIIDYYGSGFLSGDDITYRGIPLGNFITVEFESGAVAELDLSDESYSDAARAMVSIFNSGDSNPDYNNTGFTLINATLIATNCRYCVHDEHGGVLDNYSNHYVNCNMHKNLSMQYTVEGKGRSNGYALGGGLGEHGYITFDGCQFSRTNTSGQTLDVDYPIFYHTSLYSQSQAALSRIFVRDCYMDTTIRFNIIGNDALSQMFVSGCSLGSAPVIDGGSPQSGELIAWNNEIRTP